MSKTRQFWVLCFPLVVSCGIVRGATRDGMKPILLRGVDQLANEPDPVVAEAAIAADIKLMESVAETYPEDRALVGLAGMARTVYAFSFVQDELEAVQIAYPGDRQRHGILRHRLLANYRRGRAYAERALRLNERFDGILQGQALEQVSQETLGRALAVLDEDDAQALFWVAFSWGGSMMTRMSPKEAAQFPKLEALSARLLELDDHVFFGVGPHMLAGVMYGFRAPALGGDSEKARAHFKKASEYGGVSLPSVLAAQYVDAQTENRSGFESRLRKAINSEGRQDRAMFEVLAKRKACRLLANVDQYFLVDDGTVPEACFHVPHKHPFREAE